MYAKPDTFDSEDNVACSFLNLQIMHVLQYSRCLHSIKHLTKPALVCLGMSVLTDCGVLNAIRHLVDADYRILRRVWYSNWQCGAAAIVSWKWVFHGNQKIRMPMICLKKVNEFVDGHSLKDDSKDNKNDAAWMIFTGESKCSKIMLFFEAVSFFFFFPLQSFLNSFFLASRLLHCGGWSSDAWCCVLSSRVRFSGQWRVTQIVLWRERSRCAAGKSLGWQRLQIGVLFFFAPLTTRESRSFGVTQKSKFLGRASF